MIHFSTDNLGVAPWGSSEHVFLKRDSEDGGYCDQLHLPTLRLVLGIHCRLSSPSPLFILTPPAALPSPACGLGCAISYSSSPSFIIALGSREDFHLSQRIKYSSTNVSHFPSSAPLSLCMIYLLVAPVENSWWLGSKESTCKAGNLSSTPGWGNSLEKEMATHSSILAWESPWTEEPGGLQSVGSQRAGQNLATKPQPCSSPCFFSYEITKLLDYLIILSCQ